jgi:hypothetical protein
MSKKRRARGRKKAGASSRGALLNVLGIGGGIAGVLALGVTTVLARGELRRASRELGRSLEQGLARVKNAWPRIDRSDGVATSRGLS